MYALTYLIYSIFYEGMILGGCAYLVFWRGQSGWWFLLAFLLSAGIYSPEKWRKLFDPKP